MSKEYDYIVYIGRFQPFHDGHFTTLTLALEKANKVIIVIGSANSAPTPKNPWSAQDRQNMIISSFRSHPRLRDFGFVHVEDRRYKEHKWIEFIQSNIKDIIHSQTRENTKNALIGHEKDASTYYIKQNFPAWNFVETGPYIKEQGGSAVSSTKIRELMFTGHLGYTKSNLPETVYNELESFTMLPIFKTLQGEYEHIVKEEKIYENLPHGMNFITADSIVVQSGHVLLVQRDEYPGKNLWALPGVHVSQTETVQEASMRALLDETNLNVPFKVLKGSLKEVKLFDHPERSLRARLTQTNARTLTIAHHYELDSSQPLPTKGLRGGEGIKKVWWFSFSEIKRMRTSLFEDHADILDYFIS